MPSEDIGLETVANRKNPPRGAVVLIDEIDKADPDVPNNLLVPIGSLQFDVNEAGTTGLTVRASEKLGETPLVIITTNDERELPNAFLRRCLVLKLGAPDEARLVQIAQAQLGDKNVPLYKKVAALLFEAANATTSDPPGTAEYLDALATCLRLEVKPEAGSEIWEAIRRVSVHKDRSGVQAAP
jgi:MoxR-like ATPase